MGRYENLEQLADDLGLVVNGGRLRVNDAGLDPPKAKRASRKRSAREDLTNQYYEEMFGERPEWKPEPTLEKKRENLRAEMLAYARSLGMDPQ